MFNEETKVIIDRTYAKQLNRKGLIREEALTLPDQYGYQYVVVTRFDLQRTDHYVATDHDIEHCWEPRT